MTSPTPPFRTLPSFSDFKTLGEQDLEKAKQACQCFVSAILEPGPNPYTLSLLGLSGTGKTMLAKAILRDLKWNPWGVCEAIPELIHRGMLMRFEAAFRDWRKVTKRLQSGDFSATDNMVEVDLLVLDDMGTGYDPSGYTVSELDRLLRSRAGRWTVVTSNLTLQAMSEQLDRRIASWLIRDGNEAVEIKAPDYHLRSRG